MELQNKSDAEILEVVNPIMNNLMEASTRIDHAAHTRDFTDRLKAIVTKDYLERICRIYQSEKGFFGERELIAIVRRPEAVAVLWKQRFTEMEGDFVAEALFVQRDDKYLVDHTMVW